MSYLSESELSAKRAGGLDQLGGKDPASLYGTEKPEKRSRLRYLGLVSVVLSVVSGITSFIILLGLTPIEPTDDVIQLAMIVNGALLFVLAAIIFLEACAVLRARQKGRAGARLHIRVMGLFALVATVPTILVAIFASITLDRGLDRWFSSRTQAIINSSQTVASAYTKEHARVLRNELLGIAQALKRGRALFFLLDSDRFRAIFSRQTRIRGIPAAFRREQCW